MIVRVSNTNNPGDYYIVDLYKNSVNLYIKVALADRSKLAKAQPVTYTARDGLEIPALLTLATKETDKNYFIILPHGGLILNNISVTIRGFNSLQIEE